MSDNVNAVLKFTLGFLASKTRSVVEERLKYGDVTDEEYQSLIVRELDDIKSKLDGLARKDLLSSLCFLQEGIHGLCQSLFQLDSSEVTAKSSEQATSVEATASLAKAMTSLEIRSNDNSQSALGSFKLACENATKAFCNEALSIEDRIQATQMRMMARILETLDDPDASFRDCLQYLQQLHDVRAIQETFSVLIQGGIKSWFYKTKRLDNASSVQLTNQILFEFARKFTKLRPKYLKNWPVILFGEEGYRPVFGEYRLTEKLEKSGVQNICFNMLPEPDFEFDGPIFPWLSVVNSKGEIVAMTLAERAIKVFKRLGESRTLCEVTREEHSSEWNVDAMNIDAEDNVYIIGSFLKSDQQSRSFKLFIFDEYGNKKLECLLPFHQSTYSGVRIAVNKDGKIAFVDCEEETLYIGKACLEQNSFGVEKNLSLKQLGVSYRVRFVAFFGLKIIVTGEDDFRIYTDNGQLEREINIPGKEGGFINSFAINHAMKRILVEIKDSASSHSSVASFSETGELIDSFYLGSGEWILFARITSHPNGPVALVGATGAALLQLQ